jgi:hypothetical protein
MRENSPSSALPKHQNVAAILHRHRQTNCVFAHETHARRRWIVETATHIGDIGDTERTITDADRKVFYLIDRLKISRDP